MPHKPNPFQNWHDVNVKIDNGRNVNIHAENSPKIIKKYLKNVQKIGRAKILSVKFAGKVRGIMMGLPKKANRSRAASAGKRKGGKMINDSIIKKAIEGDNFNFKLLETDCNLNLSKKKQKKKNKLDNITILTYVAKCFALLGNKVKLGMKKHKKNTNLFADAIMPVSMKPRLIIENFEMVNKRRNFKE